MSDNDPTEQLANSLLEKRHLLLAVEVFNQRRSGRNTQMDVRHRKADEGKANRSLMGSRRCAKANR